MDNKEWIKVADDLPSGWWSPLYKHLSEDVLVANSTGMAIAHYNNLSDTWFIGEPGEGEEEWIDKVTHWMPLPENPNHKS